MSLQPSARRRVEPRPLVGAAMAGIATMAIALSACSPSPDGRESGSADGARVNGSERIGWSQAAPSLSEAAAYEYIVYVDGRPTRLEKVACAPANSSTYACSSQLPSLAPGRRVLELAAVRVVGGTPHEGPRSEPLIVFVDPSVQTSLASTAIVESSGSERAAAQTETLCIQPGACYSVEIWSRRFTGARSLVALPDGRALLIEDGQWVWLATPGDGLAEVKVAPSCSTDTRLAALAVDPAFETDRPVYVGWRRPSENGSALFRVSRYRELVGTLGEGATILEVPLSDARLPLMAVGGDGMLYVALPGRSSWNILRLTGDGTTPRNNPAPSPVIADVQNPVAIASVEKGIVVLGAANNLTVFSEAPSPMRTTDVVSRALGLPRSSSALGTLGVDARVTEEWWAFGAGGASQLLHRMRLAPGTASFEARGSADVGSCGVVREVSVGLNGTLWVLATNEMQGTLQPAWRLCLFAPRPTLR